MNTAQTSNESSLELPQMSKIQTFTAHNKKTIYSSDREVLAVYNNEKSELFLELSLSKKIISRVERLWNHETYLFFTDINSKFKNLRLKKDEIANFEREQKDNVVLLRQILPNEKATYNHNLQFLISEMSHFLEKNNLGDLDDLLINGEISSEYTYYFNNNVWFEIFIYAIFTKLNQENHTIFRCNITGKSGTRHEVDLAMIAPMYTVIIEAKSKAFKKQEYMDLIGKKADINADIAILISGEPNPHDNINSDGFRNVFVFCDVFSYPFDTIFNQIKGVFPS